MPHGTNCFDSCYISKTSLTCRMISLLWKQNWTSIDREYLAAFGSFTQHGQLFCTNRIQSRECVPKGSSHLEGGVLNVGCEDHQPQRLSCCNGFTACLLQGTFIPEETQLWSIEQADVFCPLLLVLVLTRKSGLFWAGTINTERAAI
jgi:hypothetical protein